MNYIFNTFFLLRQFYGASTISIPNDNKVLLALVSTASYYRSNNIRGANVKLRSVLRHILPNSIYSTREIVLYMSRCAVHPPIDQHNPFYILYVRHHRRRTDQECDIAIGGSWVKRLVTSVKDINRRTISNRVCVNHWRTRVPINRHDPPLFPSRG